MIHTKNCKFCKKEFSCNRSHKEFCSRSCYRKFPENKEKYDNRNKAYLKEAGLTHNRKYSQLVSKCKFKKYEIDISKEEYSVFLNLGCEYCGKEIKESGVSLDRKDSNKGYTKDNVVPCCGKCNQIKNIHLTHEEMKAAMKAVLEIRRK